MPLGGTKRRFSEIDSPQTHYFAPFFGGTGQSVAPSVRGPFLKSGAYRSDIKPLTTIKQARAIMARGRYGRGKKKGKGKKKKSRATYSTRSRTFNRGRYASRKHIGVGFPPRMNGVLKLHQNVNNISADETFNRRIGQILLVDMNNDQRMTSLVPSEGVSHWITGLLGDVATRYGTPYFFDTLKSLYTEYYITKIKAITRFCMKDTDVQDDITIAYKTFKPHDDEQEIVRNSGSTELLASQDRLKQIRLRPLSANVAGGGQIKTIVQSWIVKNWIPARVWFSEQGDITVGEKGFVSTLAIDSGNASHSPRCIFWAWKTKSGNAIDKQSISVEQDIYYTYTAFGRKLPAVS